MTDQLQLLADAGDPDATPGLSVRERRAHAWFCTEFNLRPELSTHPRYRFTDMDTGAPSDWNIEDIESKYLQFKKEVRRLRAAERRDRVVETSGGTV